MTHWTRRYNVRVQCFRGPISSRPTIGTCSPPELFGRFTRLPAATPPPTQYHIRRHSGITIVWRGWFVRTRYKFENVSERNKSRTYARMKRKGDRFYARRSSCPCAHACLYTCACIRLCVCVCVCVLCTVRIRHALAECTYTYIYKLAGARGVGFTIKCKLISIVHVV